MFIAIVSILSFFYLFPEIKIFSYSVGILAPFFIFSFLLTQKDFRNIFISHKKITIIWVIFLFINLISTIFSPYKDLAIKGFGRVFSLSLVFWIIFWFLKENKFLSQLINKTTTQQNLIIVEEAYTVKGYKQTSVQGRIGIWKDAIFYIIQKPLLGYGPLVHRYELTQNFAHNLFFDFLINYGIIGFIFLIYLIKEITQKVFLVRKPIYTAFFFYCLTNNLIESMFFQGFFEIIFFAFLTQLIHEKILDHYHHS